MIRNKFFQALKITAALSLSVPMLVPYTSIQAAQEMTINQQESCNHTYIEVSAGEPSVRSRKSHQFLSAKGWENCTATTYLQAYALKCTKCGAYSGGGRTVEYTEHSNPSCPSK